MRLRCVGKKKHIYIKQFTSAMRTQVNRPRLTVPATHTPLYVCVSNMFAPVVFLITHLPPPLLRTLPICYYGRAKNHLQFKNISTTYFFRVPTGVAIIKSLAFPSIACMVCPCPTFRRANVCMFFFVFNIFVLFTLIFYLIMRTYN